MLDDPEYTPIYKSPGLLIVMILLGALFFALFIGGFYWQKYQFPTLNGPWEVASPGKYLVMIAFLLYSLSIFGAITPILRYHPGYLIILFLLASIFLALGLLIFF